VKLFPGFPRSNQTNSWVIPFCVTAFILKVS
jgi:hypothetical protein